MFFTTIFIVRICLVTNVLCAEQISESEVLEPIIMEVDLDLTDKLIFELESYARNTVEKFLSHSTTYDLIVKAFLEMFDITFFESNSEYVFLCSIPKTSSQNCIDEMVNHLMKQNDCEDTQDASHFEDVIFSKSLEALRGSCMSAIKILSDFANINLKDSHNSTATSYECEIMYESEKKYDAEVILSINWLIKLTKTFYDFIFLYNYQIHIKTEDTNYIYEVIFSPGPAHTTRNTLNYNIKPELIEYYQSLQKYDFKEMSENETTNKLRHWADTFEKTELLQFITKNKDFFDVLFDVIRKKRSIRKDICYYAQQGFLFNQYDEVKTSFYILSSEEDKLAQLLGLHLDSSDALVTPPVLDFLFSPNDLSTYNAYKDAIYRDILLLWFGLRYAKLCCVRKKYTKINEILQKCPITMAYYAENEEKYTEIDKNIINLPRSPCFTSLCSLDVQSFVTNAEATLNNKRLKLIIDAADAREIIITDFMQQHSTSDIVKEIEGYKQCEKTLLLDELYKVPQLCLDEVSMLYHEVLFIETNGVYRLKCDELEHRLNTSKVKYLSQITVREKGKEQTIRDLNRKNTELYRKITAQRYSLYKTREYMNKTLTDAWKSLYDFLQELKSY